MMIGFISRQEDRLCYKTDYRMIRALVSITHIGRVQVRSRLEGQGRTLRERHGPGARAHVAHMQRATFALSGRTKNTVNTRINVLESMNKLQLSVKKSWYRIPGTAVGLEHQLFKQGGVHDSVYGYEKRRTINSVMAAKPLCRFVPGTCHVYTGITKVGV